MNNDQIAGIEQATLKAVRPEVVESLPGWLLPLDGGQVGRARCAVPLQHSVLKTASIKPIENVYRAAGLPARFRLPINTTSEPFIQYLESQGYKKTQPTWVQTAQVDDVLAAMQILPRSDLSVTVAEQPDDAWASIYSDLGKDPQEGKDRVRLMMRAQSGRYYSVVVDGQTLATGMAAFDNGWVSVHGMRTRPDQRRKHYATYIIGRMMFDAKAQAIDETFLQVELENVAAQKVYERLGYRNSWLYAYWSQ